MTTEAAIGFGALFQTESLDSPNTWRTVAEVNNIKPPAPSRDAIDLTHESGPNEWRGSMPGMKTAGEMSIKLNFVPGGDTYAALEAELDDQTVQSRRIVFPNGAFMEFDAFLKSLDPEAPIDGAMVATATFQISGRVNAIRNPPPALQFDAARNSQYWGAI